MLTSTHAIVSFWQECVGPAIDQNPHSPAVLLLFDTMGPIFSYGQQRAQRRQRERLGY